MSGEKWIMSGEKRIMSGEMRVWWENCSKK
jgi:hypothetical protein